jgi:DNA repair photolyase
MPDIVRALADAGTPFGILTKGTLLRRDLPLLASLAERVSVSVAVSIAITDFDLHQSLEPGVPAPKARLGLVRACRDAGFAPSVLVAPVLPYLSDSIDHLDATIGAIAAAGAERVSVMALNLKPHTREWFFRWLGEHRPDLVNGYERLYARGAYVAPTYARWLARRAQPILVRHGVARAAGDPYQAADPDPVALTPAGAGEPAHAASAANEVGQLSLLD